MAPMTTQGRAYLSRVVVKFRGTQGQVVLDRIRTVDKMRLVRRLGTLDRVSLSSSRSALPVDRGGVVELRRDGLDETGQDEDR